MSDNYTGGGFGDIPSNDPEERGDADGDGQRPGVNSEGFDSKYTEDGAAMWKPVSIDNANAKGSGYSETSNPNAQTPVGF